MPQSEFFAATHLLDVWQGQLMGNMSSKREWRITFRLAQLHTHYK